MQSKQIIEAMNNRDVDRIMALAKKDPQLAHAKDKNGRTPLHWAAEYGRKEAG